MTPTCFDADSKNDCKSIEINSMEQLVCINRPKNKLKHSHCSQNKRRKKRIQSTVINKQMTRFTKRGLRITVIDGMTKKSQEVAGWRNRPSADNLKPFMMVFLFISLMPRLTLQTTTTTSPAQANDSNYQQQHYYQQHNSNQSHQLVQPINSNNYNNQDVHIVNSVHQSPTTTTTTNTNKAIQQLTKPNYIETSKQITAILDRFMLLGYDKRVRPNYGGPPVEVNVTMRILSISSVSEVMMDFTADFYFRQTWHDPRLAFTKLNDIKTLYVGAEVSKKIWLPDTFFGNEKMAYFHEATTPNVFLRIDHSGEVYRSIRLTVTSSCPMNLQYFPMDRQRCTIEAESYGYNIKDIIYRWSRENTSVERDEQISLPQFDIVKTVQKYRLEELSSGTYSRLIAELHFARRMGYYLIQIYIPSSLIVVISWVSFWLHRNASPARVQLGVTTVLTMTTLMSSTNAALPKISYIKSIDIFLGTCFIMVFAALLEYATVGYLGKRIAMRKAQMQHAQSQAQARTFAQLQAQGAQGDPIPPVSSLLDSLPMTPNINNNSITQQQLYNNQQPSFIALSNTIASSKLAASRSNSRCEEQQKHNPDPHALHHHIKSNCRHVFAGRGSCNHDTDDALLPPQYQDQKQQQQFDQCQDDQCNNKGSLKRHSRLCKIHDHHQQHHDHDDHHDLDRVCHQHRHHHRASFKDDDIDQQQDDYDADGAGNECDFDQLANQCHYRSRIKSIKSHACRNSKVSDCRGHNCTLERPCQRRVSKQQQQEFADCDCHHLVNDDAIDDCCQFATKTPPARGGGGVHHSTTTRKGRQCRMHYQASLPNLACNQHDHHDSMDIGNQCNNHNLSRGQQPMLLRVPMQGALPDMDRSSSPAFDFMTSYQQQQQHHGASLAATAAAATLVNLHRKNKGLPPSTNPNFAQFKWPFNKRSVETIFGVRPSDIDKYSRVVFPVCFLCFQLMYWIIYLHISALVESV